MNRSEALAAAVTLVDDLAPRTNARGYTDGVIKPDERVSLVLRVADWLLAGEPGESMPTGHACFKCGRTDGEVVDRGHNFTAERYMHAYGDCT